VTLKHVLLAALLVSGCRQWSKPPAHPLTEINGRMVRLAWITWSNVDEIMYCTRRLDDEANQVGVLGPCYRQQAGEPPRKMLSWLNVARPDDRPPNAGPWERCAIELKETSATLLTPTGRAAIEEWKPGNEVQGDRFAVELSFSPEGKWMAVERVAVHVGEGERIVELPSVEIRPVPACR
jgi:hypothetical protein